jgi:hypothetical protein
MWPLSVLRRRRFERRRKAALIVLLVVWMVERLDADDRARVEQSVTDNYRKSADPPAVWRRYASWDVVAAEWAAAMQRLGIESALSGHPWADLFAPWGIWQKWPQWPLSNCDLRPAFVARDFLQMDPASEDARRLLREHGFDIPDESPWGLGALAATDSTQTWLRSSGLYAHWWKQK